MEWLYMAVGFTVASYAIVANDAIQTLGTFLASNNRRPWWVLWLFAGSVLSAVLVYGYIAYGGDVSYGRLTKIPAPEAFQWWHVVPPICLLALTRGGIPVSTTFIVLTVFSPKNLEAMVTKSALGYLLAFVSAIVLYGVVAKTIEERFLSTADAEPSTSWVVLQWVSTAFLWSQWLIQDLANIFVYMPRDLSPGLFGTGLAIMLALLAYTFYTSGGAIQQIVTSKTNTQDIRAAALINLLFAVLLWYFKEYSKLPMSTTWVFLGVLAGREIALTYRLQVRAQADTLKMVGSDALKAISGLVVSVVVAVALPVIADWIDGEPAADVGSETARVSPDASSP